MHEEIKAMKRIGSRVLTIGGAVTTACFVAIAAPLGCQNEEENVDLTPTVDTQEEVEEAAAAVAKEVEVRTQVAKQVAKAEMSEAEAALNAKVAEARMHELESRARELKLEAKAKGEAAADDLDEDFGKARTDARAALTELDRETDEASVEVRQRMATALDAMSEELAEWERELDPETRAG